MNKKRPTWICPKTGKIFDAYKTTDKATLAYYGLTTKSVTICGSCDEPVKFHSKHDKKGA